MSSRTVTRPGSVVPRRWGIAAVVTAVVGLLPSLFILLLAVTVSPDAPWFLFFTLPIAVLLATFAVIFAVVGLILGIRRRTGFVWPVIGIVLGLAICVAILGLFAGWYS
ncbi:hypothetical protein M4I32_11010 [Microbacterium sp. LRZ72]|uniref:hypothetical protein n=1 Tax=Microbacterium sp. LRZ72 TaxID=2942481 RepID=UPI0029AD3831|nr:hypothetical protein [Microbacterium sp. LRZ72]MDX2377328.1 hypothetical protein [Microbacterium sp. LRZ72]